MTINHHLDDSTIVSFAAGALPAAFAIVTSAHVAVCPSCREKVAQAETIGGALLDDIEPVALSQCATNNLLEQLGAGDKTVERPDEPGAGTSAAASQDKVLPPIVSLLIGTPISQIKWQRAGRGISTHQIALGDKAASKLFLMKIAAGRAVPEHGHTGHEVTMVLSGAYNDKCGRFACGDVADLDPDVEHQPVVEASEDCICLVAVERPTRFKGLLPRIFQPLVGI